MLRVTANIGWTKSKSATWIQALLYTIFHWCCVWWCWDGVIVSRSNTYSFTYDVWTRGLALFMWQRYHSFTCMKHYPGIEGTFRRLGKCCLELSWFQQYRKWSWIRTAWPEIHNLCECDHISSFTLTHRRLPWIQTPCWTSPKPDLALNTRNSPKPDIDVRILRPKCRNNPTRW